MKAVELSQKQDRSLATAPQSKLSLNQKPSMSSFLPSARPGISTMKSSQPVLKPETVKTEKPVATAVPVKEKIEIKQNSALLITGQIANRRVLRAAKPPYPRWAQEQGIQAEVFIFITVRTDGTVKDNAYVQTSSGYPELDQLAMDAVQQFQFASTAGSGDETGTVVFRFQLQR
jgi:TonB family protein